MNQKPFFPREFLKLIEVNTLVKTGANLVACSKFIVKLMSKQNEEEEELK